MHARLLISHLAVAILALGLGYAVFSPRDGAGTKALQQRPEDPVAALADALKLEDAHARAQALLDFFAVADPAWAKRLRDEVNQPGSELVLDEMGETLFASWWARSDPGSAFANRVDPGWANRHPWLREVMKAWVASDSGRAAEAVDELPPNVERGKLEATRTLVDHWWDQQATADPSPLLALIYKLEVRSRAGAIAHLIESSIKTRGIDATEQFVESIPETDDIANDLQQEMLARFGQSLIDHDVDRAIKWAEEHGKGRNGVGILRHMAYLWGIKDGPAAMNWAMTKPDPIDRPDIILRAWLSFRRVHPAEASEWLLAQEPSGGLEDIYERYLSGTASLDPKKALEIAERTKDPETRERLLAAVGEGWMKTDPEAARKWLDSVELSPAVEARIRQAVPADPSRFLAPTASH